MSLNFLCYTNNTHSLQSLIYRKLPLSRDWHEQHCFHFGSTPPMLSWISFVGTPSTAKSATASSDSQPRCRTNKRPARRTLFQLVFLIMMYAGVSGKDTSL